MHELSIALSILEIAQEEAERRRAERVTAIHIKLGPLSGVIPQALQNAYSLARENSDFAQTQLRITEIPITARCRSCGTQTLALTDLACPICREPVADILTGRELEISAMEIFP